MYFPGEIKNRLNEILKKLNDTYRLSPVHFFFPKEKNRTQLILSELKSLRRNDAFLELLYAMLKHCDYNIRHQLVHDTVIFEHIQNLLGAELLNTTAEKYRAELEKLVELGIVCPITINYVDAIVEILDAKNITDTPSTCYYLELLGNPSKNHSKEVQLATF